MAKQNANLASSMYPYSYQPSTRTGSSNYAVQKIRTGVSPHLRSRGNWLTDPLGKSRDVIGLGPRDSSRSDWILGLHSGDRDRGGFDHWRGNRYSQGVGNSLVRKMYPSATSQVIDDESLGPFGGYYSYSGDLIGLGSATKAAPTLPGTMAHEREHERQYKEHDATKSGMWGRSVDPALELPAIMAGALHQSEANRLTTGDFGDSEVLPVGEGYSMNRQWAREMARKHGVFNGQSVTGLMAENPQWLRLVGQAPPAQQSNTLPEVTDEWMASEFGPLPPTNPGAKTVPTRAEIKPDRLGLQKTVAPTTSGARQLPEPPGQDIMPTATSRRIRRYSPLDNGMLPRGPSAGTADYPAGRPWPATAGQPDVPYVDVPDGVVGRTTPTGYGSQMGYGGSVPPSVAAQIRDDFRQRGLNSLYNTGQASRLQMAELQDRLNREISASAFRNPRNPGVGFENMRGGDRYVAATPSGEARVHPMLPSFGPAPARNSVPAEPVWRQDARMAGNLKNLARDNPAAFSQMTASDAPYVGEVSTDRTQWREDQKQRWAAAMTKRAADREERLGRVRSNSEAKMLARQVRMGNQTPIDATRTRLSPGSMYAQAFRQGGGTDQQLAQMLDQANQRAMMGPDGMARVAAAEAEGRTRGNPMDMLKTPEGKLLAAIQADQSGLLIQNPDVQRQLGIGGAAQQFAPGVVTPQLQAYLSDPATGKPLSGLQIRLKLRQMGWSDEQIGAALPQLTGDADATIDQPGGPGGWQRFWDWLSPSSRNANPGGAATPGNPRPGPISAPPRPGSYYGFGFSR